LLNPFPGSLGFAAEPSTDLPASSRPETDVFSAPVKVDGVELFRVRGVSAFPAEKRARDVASHIEEAAADPTIGSESLRIETEKDRSLILAGDKILVFVYDEDAQLEGVRDHQTLARAFIKRIREAIEDWRRDRNPEVLQRNAGYVLGATLLLALFLWIGGKIYRRLRLLLEERILPKIRRVEVKTFKVLRSEQLVQLMGWLTGVIWGGIVLAAIYGYLHWSLSLFPWTRGAANTLFDLLFTPLVVICTATLHTIPDLIFLLILFFITRYFLKLVRLFFTHVSRGTVTLSGFESEWAWPTYRLVRLLLIVFALVIAYPYIPGSETAAFKGISIFMGVLVSLGSTSLIGNILAGYTMTYRRAFKEGDRVRVGNYLGDVEETRLLVTHLRNPKNEMVVIPNSVILNSELTNYSTLAPEQGLILHTTVGIGYETPWRQVEAMLLEAAARTPGLLKEPAPFVWQKTLGDFCVIYEINAYCNDPKAMLGLYTELHRNILDVFNEYDVQIMTPAYERDPEEPKVVPKDQWYAAPAKKPEG
jgi:small-conductance mechanosensitive channel